MNFYTLESRYPNDNSTEILDILEIITKKNDKSISWILCDLDIVPKTEGDYTPSGKGDPCHPVYDFITRIQRERFIVVSIVEVQDILVETTSVRRGVFLCVPDSTVLGDFYACVEPKNKGAFQHECAFHEIRVLDDLIYILSNNDLDLNGA